MRALTWQGNEHVEVTDVPDPRIQEPTDVIIQVTSTAICDADRTFTCTASWDRT
jgi:threonine dehydrogenase-like Zn-dependent dehydrogenase